MYLVLENKNDILCGTERSCLVHSENQKVFKIPHHIESFGTCMKHYI